MKYWNNEWMRKIPLSIKEYGVSATFFKILSIGIALLFDFYYRVDTENRIKIEKIPVIGSNKDHSEDYHPTAFLPIWLVINKIKKILPEKSSFIDYGCGKGRALIIASQLGIKTVKGIDFSPLLCQIARSNISNYIERTRSKTTFHVFETDVLDYQIAPEDNIFYLFNPFDEMILNQILDMIEHSLHINSRFIIIIYFDPKYGYLMEERSFCKMIKQYSFWSYTFHIYMNELREIPS